MRQRERERESDSDVRLRVNLSWVVPRPKFQSFLWQELYAQVTAIRLVETLKGVVIILDHGRSCRSPSEIIDQFCGWSQIPKTVEILHARSAFHVRDPVCAFAAIVVTIRDTAFVWSYARDERIAHKHPPQERYVDALAL